MKVFGCGLALLVLASMGVVAGAATSTAGAAGVGQYSAPVWFPLRGSAASAIQVGCTYESPYLPQKVCGTGPGTSYHTWWALDLHEALGQPVYAAGAGRLTIVRQGNKDCSAVSNSVEIDHGVINGQRVWTYYTHLALISVADGAWVDETTKIGTVGETGLAGEGCWPHLHYEKRTTAATAKTSAQTNAVDPGELKACHAGTVVSYPQAWSLSTWQGIPWGTRFAYSDGTSCAWSIVASPNPSGAISSNLKGVSCPSANSCFAVGDYFDGPSNNGLVEHWTGKSWSIVASPNPSGSSPTYLNGVSCSSATNCFAVGEYFSGSTLMERWNGTSWAVVPSPNPSGSTYNFLNGVSCPSATSCYAIGDAMAKDTSSRPLTEHWNGTHWSIVASPNPNGSFQTIMNAVSCVSATNCSAVGDYYMPTSNTKTLVEHWNGTSWSVVSSPNPTGSIYSHLNGVSCPSTTSCYAVGTGSADGLTMRTLAQHWNGKTWSIMTTPNPPGFLYGVSCPSATSCYAVGAATTGTLVEHSNGMTWTTLTTPNPSDTSTPGFFSVSCSSMTTCDAVGNANFSPAGQGTFIERSS